MFLLPFCTKALKLGPIELIEMARSAEGKAGAVTGLGDQVYYACTSMCITYSQPILNIFTLSIAVMALV